MRYGRSKLRGVVALENEDNLVVDPNEVVPAADVERAEAATEVAEEVADVNEEMAAQDEVDAQIEEATEIVEALESVAEVMAISAKNGGMDKHSAHAVGVLVQHAYSRVGLEAQAMPSLESFGSTSSRVAATQIAMEDIKEKAKKIWESIIAQIKKAIQWAADMFNKFFGSAEKLERRAKALSAKAAEARGGKAKEGEFEAGSTANALAIGGKVGDVVPEAKRLLAEAKSAFNLANTFNDAVKAAVDATNVPVEEFKLGKKEYKGQDFSTTEEHKSSNENLVSYASKPMFGNKALISVSNSKDLSGKDAVDAAAGMAMFLGEVGKKEVSDVKLKTLSADEMVALMDVVVELANTVRAYRRNHEGANAARKDMLAKASEASKDEKRAGYASMFRNYATMVEKLPAQFSAYSLNTGKALCDYVDQSLKQYKA